MLLKIVLGTVIGGLCGYLYYKFVGCPTGTCPITRNPWTSTIYGIILGLLLAGVFDK
jgi:hypothetical protein